MDNRRLLIIAAIIILISVITIYLAPSDTIIPIPNPNENITDENNNISTSPQRTSVQESVK
ncbi:MAG TPA: hypothetical protein VE130_02215 [Nitrososphaeraceae archaeon]|nr:hypothetical protein [Nitrososphaeraceae archaeon]